MKRGRVSTGAKPGRASLVLCLVALVTSLGACKTTLRPGCPACVDTGPTQPAVGCSPYTSSDLSLASITDPKLLFLSGGGAHGAWGAGVLYGWPMRPKFNVVTGISTGALQAPFVFLDTPAANATLKVFYTQTTDNMIYKWKWWAFFSNSIQSRSPLKGLIDAKLDDQTVRDVAAVPNRELWLGTVNMDTSQFCPWNLSKIAKRAVEAEAADPPETEKAGCFFDLFRDVVFAASGAPVVAPPVLIDGDYCEQLGSPGAPQENGAMHVDGGARLRVFAEGLLLASLSGSGTRTAYVIMNGKLVMHEQCVPNMIGTIGLRAFDIMMSEGVFGNLHYLENELGGSWQLRLSRIPDTYCLNFGSGDFDPATMGPLFDAGVTWVQANPPNWEPSIPPKRVIPRPASCSSSALDCRP